MHKDLGISKRKHLSPSCPSCGHSKMSTRWVWDDYQITGHAHNVFTCIDCGAVFIQRVGKDSGLVVIHKTGKIDTYAAKKSPFAKKYFAALSQDMDRVIGVHATKIRLRKKFSDAVIVSITEEQYHAYKRKEPVIWAMDVADRKKRRK